jgi:hypothetical protein
VLTKADFLIEFARLLVDEPVVLTGQECLDGLPGWDSLAVASFLAFADEQMNTLVSPKDISSSETVDDLFALITNTHH